MTWPISWGEINDHLKTPTSWNDLSDKPFYSEMEWGEPTLLFAKFSDREDTTTTDSSGSITYVGAYEFNLAEDVPLFAPDEKIIIDIDGERYEAIAYGTGEWAMGSEIIRVDFPVGSIKAYVETGSRFDIVGFAPETKIEFGLSKAVGKETVHPIDQKYIVLESEYGSKYRLVVSDNGELSTVPV